MLLLQANKPSDRQINIVQSTSLDICAEAIKLEENYYAKRKIVKTFHVETLEVVQRTTKITLSGLSASLAKPAQNSKINVRIPIDNKRENAHGRIIKIRH